MTAADAAGSGREAPIRLAFLGCGFATRLHSRMLRRLGGSVERFYASRDPEKARAFAAEHGAAGHFGSYEQAIADERIDVVVVATPPASHLDLTLRALAASKHVVVEKPAFPRSADFARVREAGRAAGRQVLVAENYFYKPLAVALRRLIVGGAVGEVLFIHLNALKEQAGGGWRDEPAQAGGGALLEGGVHWINFAANLGLAVRSARGLRPGLPGGMEKSVLVALEYEEGAVGTLSYSWEVPSLLKGLRLSKIYGREGSIAFESNGVVALAWGRRKRVLFPGLRDIAGYRAMWKDFLSALGTGEPPDMTLDLAEQDIRLVEQIYASLEADTPADDG